MVISVVPSGFLFPSYQWDTRRNQVLTTYLRHTQWARQVATAQVCRAFSFPGARLALQAGTVCTGWGEAAKLGRRQEAGGRRDGFFFHDIPTARQSSLLALFFPLSLFHYTGSSAFTLSTKGLSCCCKAPLVLCAPTPHPPPRGSPWTFCNLAIQSDSAVLKNRRGRKQTHPMVATVRALQPGLREMRVLFAFPSSILSSSSNGKRGESKEKIKEGQSATSSHRDPQYPRYKTENLSLSPPCPNPQSAVWLPRGDPLPLPCEAQSGFPNSHGIPRVLWWW